VTREEINAHWEQRDRNPEPTRPSQSANWIPACAGMTGKTVSWSNISMRLALP